MTFNLFGNIDDAQAASRAEIAAIKVNKPSDFKYWTENSTVKRQIVNYVKDVTNKKSKNFIPVEDRIAVFDMDGTILCETAPTGFAYMAALYTMLENPNNPEYRDKLKIWQDAISSRNFTPELEKDFKEYVWKIYDGMTDEEYYSHVEKFMTTQNVKGLTNLKYGESFYLPMVEIISYLNANDFTVYIITGSERRVTRAVIDGAVPVQKNHIIGCDVPYKWENNGGEKYFVKGDKILISDHRNGSNTRINKIFSIKREIGKPDNRVYEFDGKTYTPVEISALILTRLKNLVESQGGTIENVVITVPAYFGLEERSATKQAGELAGLNVLSLINEPTAAALSYCARQFQEDRTILVYDLGGGTFDVTVVQMTMTQNDSGNDVQKINVLATGGDDRLGGKDWDDKLFDHILHACCDENGITPADIEAETRQDIRSKVEEAKRKLSKKQSTKVRIDVNGSRTEIAIKRADFESMTSDLVAKTMNFVEATLEKVPAAVIDTVLLVGGSTYMPMIKDAVEQKFPGKVQQHDPDQAVAKGAAIYASMLVVEENSTGKGAIPTEQGGSPTVEHAEQLTAKFDVEDQTPRSFGPGVIDTKGSKHKMSTT